MRGGEHGEKIYMRSIQVRGEVGVQALVREAREHSRRTACEARDAREERRRVIIIYTRAARCTRATQDWWREQTASETLLRMRARFSDKSAG